MFQKIALPSDFMYVFHDFIHVYSPWTGADNPIRAKILMSTGRHHDLCPLLQVSNKSLQPLTLYTCFHDLVKVYSCMSEADNPKGTKV